MELLDVDGGAKGRGGPQIFIFLQRAASQHLSLIATPVNQPNVMSSLSCRLPELHKRKFGPGSAIVVCHSRGAWS